MFQGFLFYSLLSEAGEANGCKVAALLGVICVGLAGLSCWFYYF